MKKILIITTLFFFCSCGIQNIPTYNYELKNPVDDFDFEKNSFDLDYNDPKNWSFRCDVDDEREILPKNYKTKNEKKIDLSVFYIHPTSLFSSQDWNADTSHFVNNDFIKLCIENQASVFAGITDLYAPHYREMHIHSYTDTVNGYKAYDLAYNDILNAFKYFISNIKTDNYIIASHSQGTNHAKRLINEYISKNDGIFNRLVLSYLIGMDVSINEIPIEICEHPKQLNCFLNWRSFNNNYYPKNWNYGLNYVSVNPITFSLDFEESIKKDHMGILLPNQKIYFKKSITAINEQGLLWVNVPKNFITKKFISNSYHRADFNLFWVNIRQNLIFRFSKNL